MLVVKYIDNDDRICIAPKISLIFATKDNDIMLQDALGNLNFVCNCKTKGEVNKVLDSIYNTMLYQDGLHNNSNIFVDLRDIQKSHRKEGWIW